MPILHILNVPHAALVSVIFGLMLVSFPLGAYMVFNTNLGDSITYHIPVKDLVAFGVVQDVPVLQLGDVFVIVWMVYIILFVVAIMGPDRDMVSVLRGFGSSSNYMVQAISWFSILVLASALIDAVQGQLGAPMLPPAADNDLVQFYLITLAPLAEEMIFRVALVGLPVFAIYMHRASIRLALASLWHPSRHLHIHDYRGAAITVLLAGVLFGMAHMLSGESWGVEKVAQASVAGVILGYVYVRYGLVCSIILHWASNYFLYSYGHFVAYMGEWDILEAFEQPFFVTIQTIIMITGAIAIAAILLERRGLLHPAAS